MGQGLKRFLWVKTLVFVGVMGIALLNPTPLRSEVVDNSTLIVGMGGWKSCGKSIKQQFIAHHVYHLVSTLRSMHPDEKIAYLLTCSPGLLAAKGARPLEYFGPQGTGSFPQNAIYQVIRRAQPTAHSKIFLIGHSHGGGTGMKTAVALGNLAGLYTLEPVSPEQCDVQDYRLNRTRKIRLLSGLQRQVAGCRSAPTDVNHSRVLESTRLWQNYILDPHQDKGDIHSSAIRLVGVENIQVRTSARGMYSAHHMLGLQQHVWTGICRSISASLGGARGHGQCQGLMVNELGHKY